MSDIYDPSDGIAPPSDEFTEPGKPAPGPKAFPIKKMGQIRMSGWTIYAEGEKLYARSPSGVKTQFVLFDPEGLVEDVKQNKLSDGSDGSENSKGLTPSTTTGSSSSTSALNTTEPSTPVVADIEPADVEFVDEVEIVFDDFEVPADFEENPQQPPDNIYDTTPVLTPQATRRALEVFTGTKPSGEYTGTYFLNQDETGKPFADQFLGRTLESEEWDDLIAAVYSESRSGSNLDRAWVMGTILNRCRKSGLLVGQILLDVKQFTTVGPNPSNIFREGPGDAVDSRISVVARLLVSVARNNYYYTKTSGGPTSKNGVLGIPIGTITVFPGARWP